jgi:hypothetical protein
MSNLVHNEQVKLAATFWNNLGVAALLGVFLVPAFYTRHTMLQQALSIGVGLAAAIGLRSRSRTGGSRGSTPAIPVALVDGASGGTLGCGAWDIASTRGPLPPTSANGLP